MKYYLIFTIVIIGLLFKHALAYAERGKQLFFSSAHDVPVMPGLQEDKETSFVFDKPNGRIAILAAVSKLDSSKSIWEYYESVLPQLGWIQIGPNSFKRLNETLMLDLYQTNQGAGLHIEIRPYP